MNRFKQLLSALFLGANLCCLAALWLCCLSTWVSPSRFPTISVMGLMFPVVLSINIAFLIFWLIFRVRYTLVPLIGMLLVGSYIYDYCPMRLKSTPGGGETLTVLTFNACGIQSDSAKAAFTEYVRQVQPDILCLQEFPHSWFWREDAKALMQEMNYSHVGATDNHIMTRLAILGDTIHIAYPTRKNSSIACWVGRDGDSILVVNNHLESNQLNDEDKKEYRDMIKDPHRQTVKESSLNLLRKLSQAAVYRSAQTDVLSHIADSLSPRPIIMAGDFNDTPSPTPTRNSPDASTRSIDRAGADSDVRLTKADSPCASTTSSSVTIGLPAVRTSTRSSTYQTIIPSSPGCIAVSLLLRYL